MRPYVPGDDVRRIEWNVTARTGEPHVRVDLAERVLVTWLALDVSASMSFGTAERRKADVAEGVALALGHLASRRGNRLGLVAFGDGGRAGAPAARRAGRACSACCSRCGASRCSRAAAPTSLGAALGLVGAARAAALARRRRLRLPRAARLAAAAARSSPGGHDVLAVEIRDPREETLPNVGELRLVDPETGRQLRVDTASSRLRERFAAAAAAERAEVARELDLARRRATSSLSTEGDWLRPLAQLPAPRGEAAGELRLAARAARAARSSRSRSAATSCSSGAGSGRPPPSRARRSLPNLVGRRPGRLRHVPPALALLALAALATGAGAPARDLSVDAGAGDRRAGDRHVPLDGRDRRAADPARGRAAGGARASSRSCRRSTASAWSRSRTARTAVLPATANREAAQAALRNLRTGDGTALGEGIAARVQVAARPGRGGQEAAGLDPRPLRRRADAGRAASRRRRRSGRRS